MSTPFEVTTVREGVQTLVVLAGELDLATASAADAAIAAAANGEPGKLVIDLRGLTFMDSSGLRMLVAADRRAAGAGYELSIVRGAPAVQRVLEVTGLDAKLRLVDEP